MLPQLLAELTGGAPGPLVTIAESLWAIEPQAADSLRRRIAAGSKVQTASPVVVTENDVAVVSVRGVFGPNEYADVDTNALIETLEDLALDDSVSAILLDIKSPGGAAARLFDASDAVKQAAAVKPVVAQIDGLGASAAYYLASQASQIYATSKTDLVGSIGTRMQLIESKGLYDKLGLRSVVIDTGDYKSTGASGSELTSEQIEYLRSIVEALQTDFTAAVKSGRGLQGSQLAEVTNGKIFLADRAQALGLIDGIQPAVVTLAALASRNEKEPDMSQDTPPAAPQAATFTDIKALIPGVSNDFIVEALENHWNVDQAISTWMERQTDQLAALRAELEETKTKAARTSPSQDDLDLADRSSSSDDPATSTPPSTNPIVAWEKLVAGLMAGGLSKTEATRQAAVENEELRAAYVEEYTRLNGTASQAREASLRRSGAVR